MLKVGEYHEGQKETPHPGAQQLPIESCDGGRSARHPHHGLTIHWVQFVCWPKMLQLHGAKCCTGISFASSNVLKTFQHVNFVPAGFMPDQTSPVCTTLILCWIKHSPSSCHQHKAEIKQQSQDSESCAQQEGNCNSISDLLHIHPWMYRSGTEQPQPEDTIQQPLFQEKIRLWEISTFLPDPGLLFTALFLG